MGGRSARFANQALRIRFAKHGCTNRPFYHIVVDKSYRARDNKPMDYIGAYDPMVNDHNEKLISINFEKLRSWLVKGAEPTKPLSKLLGLSGFYPVHPMTRIEALRNNRKAEEANKPTLEQEEQS